MLCIAFHDAPSTCPTAQKREYHRVFDIRTNLCFGRVWKPISSVKQSGCRTAGICVAHSKQSIQPRPDSVVPSAGHCLRITSPPVGLRKTNSRQTFVQTTVKCSSHFISKSAEARRDDRSSYLWAALCAVFLFLFFHLALFRRVSDGVLMRCSQNPSAPIQAENLAALQQLKLGCRLMWTRSLGYKPVSNHCHIPPTGHPHMP